ncbi:hypothetical protein, partial [Hoylesella oralis]|uniref:hypothetical protein n=1 Tax=Hoylesella oralis TaxID=28134 RepID=UPI0028EB6F24
LRERVMFSTFCLRFISMPSTPLSTVPDKSIIYSRNIYGLCLIEVISIKQRLHFYLYTTLNIRKIQWHLWL